MQGSLGEKIGEGFCADVHAWAPGRVVKLFKSSTSLRFGQHEAHKTRALFAAGAPSPETFGTVTVEGRFGIVLERLEGPTLLQLSRSGATTHEQTGAILASLCRAVHKIPAPPEVPALRGWMEAWLESSDDVLPRPIATGIPALIERLQPGGELCHGDLHPGNVIMTAESPRLIDWSSAIRGPAALDLGFSHVILTELMRERVDTLGRRCAVNAALQAEHARLAGLSPAALTAAIEPYLSVVRVLVILGRAFPAERERLIQRTEAALRLEG